ncbi:chemotaxis protein CheB [Actinomycetospora flava]|uniref:protein-glutamate methylesterase n=1 Tax=Actinomycetospora flava TaxID=3129232 RepID=A0ABU8MBE1_9PSEU
MADERLIGLGASAGGIETLFELVAGLDHDLPAALFVVLHQSASARTTLPDLLGRRCELPVDAARHGAPVRAGRVVVAPPDRHLLVQDGRVVLSRGPHENGHRPGVDPLFRSLALEAGPSATGVVLSGLLDDGAAGLLEIVRHGGNAVVQDPGEALFDAMPRAALDQVPGAVVAPAGAVGTALREIVARDPLGTRRPSPQLVYEVRVSRAQPPETVDEDPPGEPAGLACPDCSGPLFALGDDRLHRFRCRVGHAWSQDSLRSAQDVVVEHALYEALRALEDKAALAGRVADAADSRGSALVARRSRRKAHEALRQAAVLRRLLSADVDDGEDQDGHDESTTEQEGQEGR